MAARTLRDRILDAFNSEYPTGDLTNAQLAARLGEHEPSVRRVTQLLRHLGIIRWKSLEGQAIVMEMAPDYYVPLENTTGAGLVAAAAPTTDSNILWGE